MLKLLAFLGAMTAASAQTAGDTCLAPGEARSSVKDQQLIEMPEAARLARAREGGEVVSANLCRVNQRLVYVVALLARDGRVARVSVDAKTRSVANHR